MHKLSFTYDESSGYPARLVADYRGLVIEAIQDESPENPWTIDDGLAPLLWYSLSGGSEEHGGADLTAPLAAIKDSTISRKWPELCKAVGVDPAELERDCREAQRDYGGRLVDHRREALESALDDMAPARYNRWPVDYADALESLWQLAGCEALALQRNGYSQGDSVLGLLVATPAWRELVGIPAGHDMKADLERQADLFGAWAFGDVYGYVIRAQGDGETLDSCWGFIGDDLNESGLAEAAMSTADSIIEAAAERRTAKLKELIRARVPVAYRPALLAEAGKLESA